MQQLVRGVRLLIYKKQELYSERRRGRKSGYAIYFSVEGGRRVCLLCAGHGAGQKDGAGGREGSKQEGELRNISKIHKFYI